MSVSRASQAVPEVCRFCAASRGEALRSDRREHLARRANIPPARCSCSRGERLGRRQRPRKELAARSTHDLPVCERCLASQDRPDRPASHEDTSERSVILRRAQHLGRDNLLELQIEQDEIRVGTHHDRPFARVAAERTGGRCGNELGDSLEREAAAMNTLRDQRRIDQRRPVKPRLRRPEIISLQLLEATRVVGGNPLERSIADGRPTSARLRQPPRTAAGATAVAMPLQPKPHALSGCADSRRAAILRTRGASSARPPHCTPSQQTS